MNHGLERLPGLPPSVRLIREMHERLMQSVRGGGSEPGELRRSQNWIGPAGSTPGGAAFVPPPFEEVPRALGDLEVFLHRDDGLPPLVRIGLAHAQFGTIHPFLDGNGRVGRLLIAFFLCERKILEKPVLYISHFFKRRRAEYYERLQAVRDVGDWEGWLAFFLRGVAEIGDEAVATARRILDLREARRAAVTAGFGRAAGNGHRVLEALYRTPVVTVPDVRGIANLSYPAANPSSRTWFRSASWSRSATAGATGRSSTAITSASSPTTPTPRPSAGGRAGSRGCCRRARSGSRRTSRAPGRPARCPPYGRASRSGSG